MRTWLSLAVLVVVSVACSSSSTPSDDSCALAKDSTNCWRTFVKTVDDCLTDDSGGEAGVHPRGTMSADAKTCTYASGRTVTFALDPRVTSTGSTSPDRDFTVTVNGNTCLHFVRNAGGMSFTGPGGTLTEDKNGTLTCPDGSRHGIGYGALNCLDAAFAGGLPGYVSSSSSNSWLVELSGAAKPAYDCSTGTPAPGT